MNIRAEKDAIINRLQQVEDESLILAIRQLLDASVKEHNLPALDQSINKALAQSKLGLVISGDEVMAQLKRKWQA